MNDRPETRIIRGIGKHRAPDPPSLWVRFVRWFDRRPEDSRGGEGSSGGGFAAETIQ